jgi:hypothetical protein
MEGAMHDSQRYRDMAAECLRASQQACEPHYRKLQLSMAVSWLSLARQDEAMDDLLASWDTAESITTDRLAAQFPSLAGREVHESPGSRGMTRPN